MSKILVVSDSHSMTRELTVIRERHRQEVDLMIHCGDSQLAADDPAMTGFVAVGGNCDMDSRLSNEAIHVVDGRKIYVTHGHRYSVKTSLMSLSYRAQEVNADIVCFGHSHVLGAEVMKGTLFLNPGSIRFPRGRREKTYVILDVCEEKVTMMVYELNGKKLPVLSREFTLPKK